MPDELIGVSESIRHVLELVKQVAPSRVSVLITGETGTGKELIASAIHRGSPRHEHLLVPVNVAAIPIQLLESELFGHVRGAFTGAEAERAGKFELAHNGTLFLDEVADAPLVLQPKILRVLQDGVVERVGSNKRCAVDVRVVSATNRDLDAAVAEGTFRSDLFYRLRVVPIQMPPLRERRCDIPLLATHFLKRFGQQRTGGVPTLTAKALRLLQDYPWPGNVRELGNVIERAVVLCRDGSIGPDLIDVKPLAVESTGEGSALQLENALDRVERDMILRALAKTERVKTRAARLLGLSERSLRYRLKKHGIS